MSERKELYGEKRKIPISINETPIETLDCSIKKLVEVIKPSQSSLKYERME